MPTRTNVDFAKRIFRERLGNPYVYGGVFSPTNTDQGCDCSALVAHELNAVLFGAAMTWQRVDPTQGNAWITTESWRPIEVGDRGPFGTITAASAAAIPADAVVKIALHHGPGGGANSHMNCTVDGVLMESSGDHGVCTTGTGAIPLSSSYWNDWAYLPGPIDGGGTGGFPMALSDKEQRDLYDEIMKRGPSRSFMAADGKPIETLLGFIYNSDGNDHTDAMTRAYLFDVPLAVEAVEKIARDGVAPDSWAGKQAWLREFGQEYCKGLVRFKARFNKLLDGGGTVVNNAVLAGGCALGGNACGLVAGPK